MLLEVNRAGNPTEPGRETAMVRLSFRSAEKGLSADFADETYPINPGGIPFIILPNFLAPKPFEKLRIIFFICRYCFRS